MEITWSVDEDDIKRLQDFVAAHAENAFVRFRIKNNVDNPPTAVSLDLFWEVLVGCLLSSMQRSGPNSYVSRFLRTKPFPLPYNFYQHQKHPVDAGRSVLKEAGGIRFNSKIAVQLAKEQRSISISEFFIKNRHLLGFDNPKKALLTPVKEAVDNSLDACE